MTFFSEIPVSFYLLTFSSILFFVLGAVGYMHGKSKAIGKVFFLFAFSVVLWTLAVAARFLTNDHSIVLIATRLSYTGASFVGFMVAYFCYLFPKKNTYRFPFMILFPVTVAIAGLSAFTPMVIEDVLVYSSSQTNVFGFGYLIFAIFFPAMVGLGIINLIRKRGRLSREGSVQARFILVGFIISTLVGFITNFLIPVFTDSSFTEQYGPLTTIFFLVPVTYAIVKHHLFNIKVIATEVFAGVLLLLLLVNVFSFTSTAQLVLNIAMFVAAVVIAIFLIRSVLQEVSLRERLESLAEQLAMANAKLKQVDRVKSEFISIASHQLRTPLSIIKGYSSMAIDGDFGKPANKQQGQVFKKIYTSTNRLINLVEDLLNISRLEQGRLGYEFEKIDPKKMVSDIISELQPKAEAKKLDLVFENTKAKVSKITADYSKLRQVFLNLIDNSIKYTEVGSVKARVEMKGKTKIRVIIQDTGIGLTQGELSTIFKRFVRGNRVTALYTEGVGLGLYFARSIVDVHQGTLRAESKGKGKGSQFIVDLPVKLDLKKIKQIQEKQEKEKEQKEKELTPEKDQG